MYKTNYTFSSILCRNCLHNLPMIIETNCKITEEYYDYVRKYRHTWEQGSIYSILRCQNCSQITICSSHWHDGMEDESELFYEILYPEKIKIPKGLPQKIEREYKDAMKYKTQDANTFGYKMRHLLENICLDKNAQGIMLFDKIKYLATNNEIPDKLVDVANHLKNLGNIGVHPELGELTKDEVDLLIDLTNAILEYVYSAPFIAEEAHQKLLEIKK